MHILVEKVAVELKDKKGELENLHFFFRRVGRREPFSLALFHLQVRNSKAMLLDQAQNMLAA